MLKSKGYNLLELLVVIVLLIMTTLMISAQWVEWLNITATAIQVNQLIAAINFARSEAIKHNVSVSLCPSTDGISCQGNWHEGYLVFIDKGQQSHVPNPASLLRVYRRTAQQGRIIWHGKGVFQVHPIGLAMAHNSHFSYCPPNKDIRYAREIIISTTGRVRVVQPASWPCPE